MIGVSLSDLHLGFTGPGRLIGGRNGREIDVEIALGHAVDRIIEVQPDLVTIAGDVFHTTRPSYHAVRALQEAVRSILSGTRAHLVVIPGNHESPRTAAALSPNIVIADADQRVHYVDDFRTLILYLNGEKVAVTCAPFSALGPSQQYALAPQSTANVNVLLIHAAVRTSADPHALPHFYGAQGIDIAHVEGFDVIACGDYHEFTRLHPDRLAFYSGAIERTSSNIWQEYEPKGVVRWDTAEHALELLTIPTRTMQNIDGGIVENPDAINCGLAALLSQSRTDDSIVRVKVSCPRWVRDQIDWSMARELKRRCFYFHFDVEWTRNESIDLGDRRARSGITLQQAAADFFANDPEDVRACALGYLEAA